MGGGGGLPLKYQLYIHKYCGRGFDKNIIFITMLITFAQLKGSLKFNIEMCLKHVCRPRPYFRAIVTQRINRFCDYFWNACNSVTVYQIVNLYL